MRARAPFVVVLVSLSFLATGSAFAQTPDGSTPFNEGICEPLFLLTPKLYGLCVAYCVALDCDIVDGAVQCGNPPDPRILELYNRLKRPFDPPMPCVLGECPCWTEEELDAMIPEVGTDRCRNNLDLNDLSTPTCTALNNSPGSCRLFPLPSGAAAILTRISGPMCLYTRLSQAGFGLLRLQVVGFGDATICSEELQARGFEGGWDCFP